MHGDKLHKNDERSDIHHAWVDLNGDGLTTISDKRIAIHLMCTLVGYSYTPPDSKWHEPFEPCDEDTITPIRPAAGGVRPAAGYPPPSFGGASSGSVGQGALHAGSRSAGSSSQAEVPPPMPDRHPPKKPPVQPLVAAELGSTTTPPAPSLPPPIGSAPQLPSLKPPCIAGLAQKTPERPLLPFSQLPGLASAPTAVGASSAPASPGPLPPPPPPPPGPGPAPGADMVPPAAADAPLLPIPPAAEGPRWPNWVDIDLHADDLPADDAGAAAKRDSGAAAGAGAAAKPDSAAAAPGAGGAAPAASSLSPETQPVPASGGAPPQKKPGNR